MNRISIFTPYFFLWAKWMPYCSLNALMKAILLSFLLLSPLISMGCFEARQITFQVTPRTSCGKSLSSYDISCLSSLEILLWDSDGAIIDKQCNVLTQRYSTLQKLLSSTTLLPLLEETDSRQGLVTVELRGYHSFNQVACDDPRERELIMWGSSESTDLSKPTLKEIMISLECRPDCDCADFDAPIYCRETLVYGVCTTDVTQDCTIDGGPKGLCAPCSGTSDCDSGQCLINQLSGESYCALRCPESNSSAPCPTGTSCHSLGNDFQLLP